MRQQRGIFFWIAQQTGDITHENQTARFQRNRRFRRRDIRVAVVNLSVIAKCRRTDYRRDAASNTFPQWFHVHVANFADESKIDISIFLIFRRKSSTSKNIKAGETARLPAEVL